MEKKCVKCEKIQPVNNFTKRKDTKDGLQFYCKSCMVMAVNNSTPKPKGVYISEEGYCVNWSACMPSRKNVSSFMSSSIVREKQQEWINSHDCFVSNGRVYADVFLGKNPYIFDAITGTLYDQDGICRNDACDLTVDLSLVERDKNYIKELVCLQH